MHSAELSVFRAIIVLAIIMVLQPVAIAKVHDADLWAAFKFGIKNTLNSMAAGANNMAGVALATASAGIIVGRVSLWFRSADHFLCRSAFNGQHLPDDPHYRRRQPASGYGSSDNS